MKPISAQFDNAATNAATGGKRGQEHRFLTVDNVAAMLPVVGFRERLRINCIDQPTGLCLEICYRFHQREIIGSEEAHQ
jgi:hypothetical protein